MARTTSRTARADRAEPAIVVRPSRRDDAAALSRLRAQADAFHARLLPDFFRVPESPSRAPPEGDAASAVLVAVGAHGPCGYVVVNVVDTPRDPTMMPRRRAHVDLVVVDEAERRRGVGARLMRAADEWAAKSACVELVLTVWSENRVADEFYRALGYEPIARVLRKSVAAT